jgi:hypothetical protein
MPDPTQESGIRIDSVSFSERGIEIMYSEDRDVTPHVVMGKALLIQPDACEPEVVEVLEAIEALVDAALLLMRNPPERIPGRRR